jgi:hypothetical protein
VLLVTKTTREGSSNQVVRRTCRSCHAKGWWGRAWSLLLGLRAVTRGNFPVSAGLLSSLVKKGEEVTVG